MPQTFRLIIALLLIGACSKHVARNVGADDDEELNRLSAQLEEIKAGVQAREPPCSEWCPLARRVCDISRRVCDISARNADRPARQKRCSANQEDCAKFNDRCTSCGKR